MKRFSLIGLVLAFALSLQGCPFLVVGAAVGGSAVVANERRTSDSMLADERIEWAAIDRLRSSGKWEQMNLSATSYNRIVLLTGQVASDEVRQLADKIVSEIPGARGVSNELVVGKFRNFGARTSDSMVTTQVKARLVGTEGVNSGHVKVVTESGVVYLMGLVTQRESDAIAKVAAGTQGVTKVVKYFEYIPEPPGKGDGKT